MQGVYYKLPSDEERVSICKTIFRYYKELKNEHPTTDVVIKNVGGYNGVVRNPADVEQLIIYGIGLAPRVYFELKKDVPSSDISDSIIFNPELKTRIPKGFSSLNEFYKTLENTLSPSQ